MSDWCTAVHWVLLSLVLQTAMHVTPQSPFVVDTFWDVEPVHCAIPHAASVTSGAVVELVCASDETHCSVQYTLQLVSNVS